MTDDNTVQPSELLLVGCSTNDPFATLVVNPRTGVSTWSHKGNEFQGGAVKKGVPLGRNGDHLVFSTLERSFLHVIGVNTHEKFHARTTVSGVVTDFVANSDGSLLFAAIGARLFVWLMSTGDLLGVRDMHFQDITHIALSDDNSMVVTASEEGEVKVHLVSDVVSVEGENEGALRCWRAHSLGVRGLSLSSSRSLRVASCAADHTAAIHSVALDACLLKVSADRPLTACLLCGSESRLWLATDLGAITGISLNEIGKTRSEHVNVATTNSNSQQNLLLGHQHEVKRLALNADATLLCSGDADGKYIIWEARSKQILKENKMSGPVSTLRFIPVWRSLTAAPDKTISRPNFALQSTINQKRELSLLRRERFHSEEMWTGVIDSLLSRGGEEGKKRKSVGSKAVEEKKANGEETPSGGVSLDMQQQIDKLKEENLRLKAINSQMFEFASKELARKTNA